MNLATFEVGDVACSKHRPMHLRNCRYLRVSVADRLTKRATMCGYPGEGPSRVAVEVEDSVGKVVAEHGFGCGQQSVVAFASA